MSHLTRFDVEEAAPHQIERAARNYATEGRLARTATTGRCVPRGCLPGLLANAVVRLYRWRSGWWRSTLRRLVTRAERGEMFSLTLRRIFARYYGVEIGLYTHGGCFVPNNMAAGVVIGRYCSIAITACAFTRNHPMNLRSSHALFFNPELGFAGTDFVPRERLVIGHDVWIGHNATILASVTSIGDGAVIAAHSVVNKNVPPYAVVTGNPSRIARYRFSDSVMADISASRWWEHPLEELLPEFADFQRPLEDESVR
jgi:virginiamycin A acetyltransferase